MIFLSIFCKSTAQTAMFFKELTNKLSTETVCIVSVCVWLCVLVSVYFTVCGCLYLKVITHCYYIYWLAAIPYRKPIFIFLSKFYVVGSFCWVSFCFVSCAACNLVLCTFVFPVCQFYVQRMFIKKLKLFMENQDFCCWQ